MKKIVASLLVVTLVLTSIAFAPKKAQASSFYLNLNSTFKSVKVSWKKQKKAKKFSIYRVAVKDPYSVSPKRSKYKKIKTVKESIIKEPISFTTSVAQDLTLEDYIADNMENSPCVKIEKYDFEKDIKTALNILSNRERFIILNRFGLEGRKRMTLEELGKILGFSKERIRQIEEKAVRKLRFAKEAKHLRDYLR